MFVVFALTRYELLLKWGRSPYVRQQKVSTIQADFRSYFPHAVAPTRPKVRLVARSALLWTAANYIVGPGCKIATEADAPEVLRRAFTGAHSPHMADLQVH